ncbi:hypothetical protein [Actinoplanes flavus]|uniref:Uncharacterized protein n=1 Tax=Actinoplanes flavus TaxID=2820290 RepID=A0ABS3UD37_9ACTN|nr:hypothetical protein [Actinoplanes flavus]MBO3736690.1 hypothetical protein [Actinoplanes flavus]
MAVLTARRLIDEQKVTQALALLESRLSVVDLSGYTTDEGLIAAALQFAKLLHASDYVPNQVEAPARFAYTSAVACGDVPRHALAGDLLGQVLQDQARYRHAALVRADVWQLFQQMGWDENSAATLMRLRLADSLHHGGRCGEALRHTEQAWRAWLREPERWSQHGVRIAVAYGQVLVGCGLRAEACGLLARSRCLPGSLEAVLEPILTSGSPEATVIIARHRSVCARRLMAAGTPDLEAMRAADNAWYGHGTGGPR